MYVCLFLLVAIKTTLKWWRWWLQDKYGITNFDGPGFILKHDASSGLERSNCMGVSGQNPPSAGVDGGVAGWLPRPIPDVSL